MKKSFKCSLKDSTKVKMFLWDCSQYLLGLRLRVHQGERPGKLLILMDLFFQLNEEQVEKKK